LLQVKDKVNPRTSYEGPEGKKRSSSTLPLIPALDGVGSQRHAPATLFPGKRPCVGPRAGLEGCGKCFSHLDSIPAPSSPSESVHWLRYLGPLLPKAKLWSEITCTGKRSCLSFVVI